MGANPENITGNIYGKLTAIKLIETGRLGAKWLCSCECGQKTTAWAYKLKAGRKKSCGCLWIKNGKYANGKGQGPRLTSTWQSLKQRCENPNNKDYRYYGARGVTVCREWHSFRDFEAWALDNGYREGLTIDRIDGNGNYSPDNCHWIPASENCKKQNRKNGVTTCSSQDVPYMTSRIPALT
jgi:hypothetical protein